MQKCKNAKMAGDETRFDQRMMLRREMIDFERSLYLRVVKDVVFMQKHKMHQEESQRLFFFRASTRNSAASQDVAQNNVK